MDTNENPYAYANQPAPPSPDAPQGNWFARNWKWFVPVGCFVPLISCCGCLSLLTVFGLGALKATPTYTQALQRAENEPRVVAAVGTPFEPAFWLMGQYNLVNGTANADLMFDVTGPNGSATIHAIATETGGQVNFTTLTIQIHATGETLDLLEADAANPGLKSGP
jgi:hypothetical protein